MRRGRALLLAAGLATAAAMVWVLRGPGAPTRRRPPPDATGAGPGATPDDRWASRRALRAIVAARVAASPDATPTQVAARLAAEARSGAPALEPLRDLEREVGRARARALLGDLARAAMRHRRGEAAAAPRSALPPREAIVRLTRRLRAAGDPAARAELIEAYFQAARRLPAGDRREALRALRTLLAGRRGASSASAVP